MVSGHVTGHTGTFAHNLIQENLLLRLELPNLISSDLEEFDFDDVFGPVAALPPVQSSQENLRNDALSLNLSITLNKLTINEAEDIWLNEERNEDCLKKLFDEDEAPLIKTCSTMVGFEDFEVLNLVGQGAYGKVFQVQKKGTYEIYAMKVIRKDKIMKNNNAEYIKAERDILTKIDHPFIVQLRYSFQTKYRLYLVFDFVNGGDLYFHLYHEGLFHEDVARFYAAEIVSAVSHLHSIGIMHRDLKPENILIDANGHGFCQAMLTDFGFAKQFDENTKANSLCGTVDYMAPEIIVGNGHDKAADWWSVGVILFEMLIGQLPFNGGNRDKIQQKILKEKIRLPSYLSTHAHSLLKALLEKKPNKRLGSGPDGSEEIKKHKWFKSINWKKLDAREIRPSFCPAVSGELCIANFNKKWTNMRVLDSPAGSPHANDFTFRGFSYTKPVSS